MSDYNPHPVLYELKANAPPDLEAIRARNEAVKACECPNFERDSWLACNTHDNTAAHTADIDTLLAEVERLNELVSKLDPYGRGVVEKSHEF